MCFYRPAIHSDGLRNFCVAAALQQQIDDLLLPRTQPYRPCFFHCAPKEYPRSIETPVSPKLCAASMNYL
jgi:hypothetical protein